MILILQEYIEWLNDQLPENEQVDNISQSLADGTLILKALSVSYLHQDLWHYSWPNLRAAQTMS